MFPIAPKSWGDSASSLLQDDPYAIATILQYLYRIWISMVSSVHLQLCVCVMMMIHGNNTKDDNVRVIATDSDDWHPANLTRLSTITTRRINSHNGWIQESTTLARGARCCP